MSCDPRFPSVECLSTEHCVPTPDNAPFCEGPIGVGLQYDACATAADCGGPLECVDTGDPLADYCCLTWCVTDLDCTPGSTCTPLSPAVYAGGLQYGVCYDGLGGCF